MQLIKGDSINDDYRNAVIKKGMEMPIRKLEASEAKATIARALQAVCGVYGLENPASDVLAICIDTIQKQFGAIGAGEIIHATQLHASGHIAKDARFYSKLSVKVFGEILADYLEYRRAIVYEIHKEQEALEQAESERRKAHEMQQAYYKQFPELLATFTGAWDEIPVHWYDTALKLGLMNEPNPEYKREIWERAKELARAETERDAAAESNIYALKGILKNLEKADGLEGKAVAISKKLIVYENFIKR